MEAFQDFEEKITCPYDKAHFIRKSKMGVHLVKCSKNFPDVEIVTCDFNTTHRIPRPELRYHHEICEDRKKIETQIIQQNDEDPSKIYPIQQVHVEVEEYWDDEYYPTYDPAAYCVENNVLRHIDVQSAAKRRNFRLEERERLNRFRDAACSKRNDDSDSSTTNTRDAAPYHPDSVKAKTLDSAKKNGLNPSAKTSKSTEEKNGQVTTKKEPISTVSIEEDAAHLSLVDRIKKGHKKTYQPKN